MKYVRTFFYLDKFIKEFAKVDEVLAVINMNNVLLIYPNKIYIQINFDDNSYIQINFGLKNAQLTRCFYEKCIGFKDSANTSYGLWRILEAKFSYYNVKIDDIIDKRFELKRYLAVNGIGELIKKRYLSLRKFSFYTGEINHYMSSYVFKWNELGEVYGSYLKSEDFFINNYLVKMINPTWLKYAKSLR